MEKPFVMENKDYVHRRDTLYTYDAGKYTRGSIAIPVAIEKKELYFYTMAKPHQEVFADCYADCNEVTMAEMTTIFNGGFRADKNIEIYAQLLQAHRAKIDATRSSHCRQQRAKRR